MRPFTDKQIALVQNFAAQAVIAIENTRLLTELRARTDELARSVEELRALGEVSQAVNSTLELETVLDTIVAKAVQLSATEAGAIYVFDEAEHEFRLRATYGMDEQLTSALQNRHIGLDDANIGEAMAQHEPIQVADLRQEAPTALNEIIACRRLSRALDRAAVPRRGDRRSARGAPQDAWCIPAEYRRSDENLRGAIGAGDPERAAVPRDRGQEPAGRGSEQAQVPVPCQHEP